MPAKTRQKAPATLLEAARDGDLAATRALLDAGADPNAPGEYEALPLVEAVGRRLINADAEAIARLLLERGADPMKPGAFGETALGKAALIGARTMAREMVDSAGERFTPFTATDATDMSLLHRACSGGFLWLVERCVAAGADPRSIDCSGSSSLHHATTPFARSEATAAERLALVDWLLDRGLEPNLNRPGEWGGTPLHCAAAGADAAVVARLLDRGADLDARTDVSAQLPIHRAAYNGSAVIRLLCDRGAKADATDVRGCHPLHVVGSRSRHCEHSDGVDAFVDCGANINALDGAGVSPLAAAIAAHGNTRAPPNERQRALFARFVARGADLRCAAPGGATLLILAGRIADVALAQMAIPGSELDQYDGHGWSALHYAATQADGAIAGALLAAGADPKQPTRKRHSYARKAFAAGITPTEIAREVGAAAVVERLTR